ncbi:MAG: PqqD family peptide modification chaperone [Bacteroidaceae bacterium]|nr:PqqD family peptide modification chaperone [Bacteroidaceae bacterium]MCF0186263.1 PqqD family peptide modification chaperone [Bacteroidaceae bacterium]
MRITDGFRLRTIAGEHYVMGEGIKQVGYNKILTLNDAAAWLWREVEGKEFSIKSITELILDKYSFSQEQAEFCAKDTIQNWLDLQIIEV